MASRETLIYVLNIKLRVIFVSNHHRLMDVAFIDIPRNSESVTYNFIKSVMWCGEI